MASRVVPDVAEEARTRGFAALAFARCAFVETVSTCINDSTLGATPRGVEVDLPHRAGDGQLRESR